MRPSSTLRCSPKRDLRVDNHKRGRSLEGGLFLREKTDDLALFSEMENRVKDSFLLHSFNDFEESLYLKPGISIPVQGGRNDLLNADGEKNDYDWLLTPPDTPLFPSLDDETQPVNLVQRGRPRSQPMSISRSTIAEKSYGTNRGSPSPNRLSSSPQSNRTRRGSASPQRLSSPPQSNRISRGSASPQRLSPSPQSNRISRGSVSPQRLRPSLQSNRTSRCSASPQRLSPSPRSNWTSRCSASPQRLSTSPQSRNSTFQSRERPSSASRSSPPPHLRSITPSRKMFTSPSIPSTPGMRSSTPNPRRMSMVSSSNVTSSEKRCSSPVNTSGTYGSPYVQAWQDFSMDVPPNLRTSLSDRPVSYVRGSSPASRKGIDSSPKFGRQSMSPTASRSPRSSYSFDRDQCSSQGKESIASSGDNDIESLQSTTMSISYNAAAMKDGLNSRALAYPNKPSRTLSTTSAPKRSFNSAGGQTEQRGPQNMFRRLLSSIPSTGINTGKANYMHHSMISRDVSVTTSSDASSVRGGSVALHIDGSTDHDRDDMVVERDAMGIEKGSTSCPVAQNELVTPDEVDEINGEIGRKIPEERRNIAHHDVDIGSIDEVEPVPSGKFSLEDQAREIVTFITELSYGAGNLSGVDSHGSMKNSKFGNKFSAIQQMEESDCCDKGQSMSLTPPETTVVDTQNSTTHSELTFDEPESCYVLELEMNPSEFQENTWSDAILGAHEIKGDQDERCLLDGPLTKVMVDVEQSFVNQRMLGQLTVGSTQHELENGHTSVNIDVSEGAGISVPLQLSRSSEGPVVQGRPCIATNIPYDDPSYARDNLNSVRNSVGHENALVAPLVDMSSSEQTNACFQQQLSDGEADIENSQHDVNTKPHSCGTFFSGASNHAYQAHGSAESSHEENDGSVESVTCKVLEETLVAEGEGRALHNRESDDRSSSRTETDFLEGDELHGNESSATRHSSALPLYNNAGSIQFEDTSVVKLPNNGFVSPGNAVELSDDEKCISGLDGPDKTSESTFTEEDAVLNNDVIHGIDLVKVQTCSSSVMLSGDLENDRVGSPDLQSACMDSPNLRSIIGEQDPSVPTTLEKDTSISPLEFDISDHTLGILEESTAVVNVPEGHNRSLTLEEAADTTLFCRSIIQKLAYQATTIAAEKDNSDSLEGSHPTVTIVGKTISDRKDLRARSGRRSSKIQKARHKRVETNVKTPSTRTETDIVPDESSEDTSSVIPSKVDSGTKPPKLESKCNCTVM